MQLILASNRRDPVIATHLDKIRSALAVAESAAEFKRIIDITAILADAAKKAQLSLQTVNEVQQIRLDAEIGLGRELERAKKSGKLREGRPEKTVVSNDSFSLGDYRISRDLSARSQIFALYEKEVRAYVNDALAAENGELSILKLFADLRRDHATSDLKAELDRIAANEPKTPAGQFDVLVIDPPWPLEKFGRDVRPNQPGELDYPTMSAQELLEWTFPREKAREDCHVFLWTTHRFLPLGFQCVEAWEAKYVCTFVWHKPGGIQPLNFPQLNCEFCLYARYGIPKFVDVKAFNACFEAPRSKHSEKPEEFYEVLRRVTAGRRLDMFNRRAIEGFIGWGKEAFQDA